MLVDPAKGTSNASLTSGQTSPRPPRPRPRRHQSDAASQTVRISSSARSRPLQRSPSLTPVVRYHSSASGSRHPTPAKSTAPPPGNPPPLTLSFSPPTKGSALHPRLDSVAYATEPGRDTQRTTPASKTTSTHDTTPLRSSPTPPSSSWSPTQKRSRTWGGCTRPAQDPRNVLVPITQRTLASQTWKYPLVVDKTSP